MQLVYKLRNLLIFLTLLSVFITVLFIFLFERFAVPVALAIAEEHSVTFVNTSLNNSVKESCSRHNINSSDLYTAQFDSNGKLTYLDVNSMLINELCAETAEQLSLDLNNAEISRISLPLGTLTGIHFLSEYGPAIPIGIIPLGSAKADYETALESAGIGQVNFKVWLVTECNMGMVNPLLPQKIKITRKLMLVNTVFSGEVPNAFYGEKINTN
jgi:sporulation protein YunB